jgi:hypothetical protein
MVRFLVWLLAMVILLAVTCSAGASLLLYLGHWIGHDDEDEDEDEHEGD